MGFLQKTIDPGEALTIWSNPYRVIIDWDLLVVLQQGFVTFQRLDDQIDGLLQQQLSEVAQHHLQMRDVHLNIAASHGPWLQQLDIQTSHHWT